jgi:hypothetical protein
MSRITYPANSPYASTPQTSWYIGILAFRPIPPDTADQPFILQMRHQYRPDRLSYDLYNTPSYWWVFCERNPFLRRDPIWAFVNGLEIIVPAANYLQQLLGA